MIALPMEKRLTGEELGNTTRVARGGSEHVASQSLQVLVLEASGVSVYPLDEAAALSIGRADECDIKLRDPLASRRHATLHVRPLMIEDHGSANGTHVGSSRLEPGASISVQLGQAISIGSSLLIVRRRDDDTSPGRERRAAVALDTDAPVVHDSAMQRLYEMTERVAQSPINVLILGETGAGKEVIAETIHRRSPRREAGFVRINCAAISEALFESELFGHERGAFTGAVVAKPGLIELADKGTVFLDEVGELGLGAQAKLLRVIETHEVTRVGGVRQRAVDVRFVAATNRDLDAEIARGVFRADLFFRLNGLSLLVPPLRERSSEIIPLAQLFLAKITERMRMPQRLELAPDALELLLGHGWPGNVRELRNVVERAAVLCSGSRITACDLALPAAAFSKRRESAAFQGDGSRDHERDRIIEALEKCHGNQTRAAKLLGMPRRTLVAKLTAHSLPRPRKSFE
jgi:DNA-binding NtrC family response regulator